MVVGITQITGLHLQMERPSKKLNFEARDSGEKDLEMLFLESQIQIGGII